MSRIFLSFLTLMLIYRTTQGSEHKKNLAVVSGESPDVFSNQSNDTKIDIEPTTESPFSLYSDCQPLLDKFRHVATAFTNCSIANAIPPLLCKSCAEQYIDLLNAYQQVMDDTNITSMGRQCSQVLTNSYIYSFVQITFTYDSHLWEISNCDTCVSISQLAKQNYIWSFTNSMKKFGKQLHEFHDCVSNNSLLLGPSDVCNKCNDKYRTLYSFYWDNYIYPDDANYCIDIESSMNDTINLWRDVWNCTAEPPEAKSYRSAQTAGVIGICLTVVGLHIVFYVVLYFIGTAEFRNLMKYSATADTRTYRSNSQMTGNLSARPTMMNPADLHTMYHGIGQMTPSMSASQRELFVRQHSGDNLDNCTNTPVKKRGPARKVTCIEEEKDENDQGSGSSSSHDHQPQDVLDDATDQQPNDPTRAISPATTIFEHL